MAFKVGDKIGDHAVVMDLLTDKVSRPNFGYRQFDVEPGTKLGDYTVVAAPPKDDEGKQIGPDPEGAEAVWIHIEGSPEGTSNKVWLK